jgi:hypothetical protein
LDPDPDPGCLNSDPIRIQTKIFFGPIGSHVQELTRVKQKVAKLHQFKKNSEFGTIIVECDSNPE